MESNDNFTKLVRGSELFFKNAVPAQSGSCLSGQSMHKDMSK
ncbi:MAG: hypothetical protein WC878_06320 [Candidatus Paceibacterota bacterium]